MLVLFVSSLLSELLVSCLHGEAPNSPSLIDQLQHLTPSGSEAPNAGLLGFFFSLYIPIYLGLKKNHVECWKPFKNHLKFAPWIIDNNWLGLYVIHP